MVPHAGMPRDTVVASTVGGRRAFSGVGVGRMEVSMLLEDRMRFVFKYVRMWVTFCQSEIFCVSRCFRDFSRVQVRGTSLSPLPEKRNAPANGLILCRTKNTKQKKEILFLARIKSVKRNPFS